MSPGPGATARDRPIGVKLRTYETGVGADLSASWRLADKSAVGTINRPLHWIDDIFSCTLLLNLTLMGRPQ